jgi:uncharacterized protein (TIGR02594 family)
MVQLFAFRRSLRLVALALCAMALAVVSISPASARSHHGAGRHAHAHFAGRYLAHRHYRHVARQSRWDAGVAQMRAGGFANANASIGQTSFAPSAASSTMESGGFSSSNVVSEARRYIGGNPTGRGSLWCARFMNLVLQHSGYKGTGSDMASSFANYGQRISGPQVGAIAVMGRSGRAAGGSAGGHVGVVSGIDPNGNPIIISGNHGHTVAEAVYPRNRIFAYVMP